MHRNILEKLVAWKVVVIESRYYYQEQDKLEKLTLLENLENNILKM